MRLAYSSITALTYLFLTTFLVGGWVYASVMMPLSQTLRIGEFDAFEQAQRFFEGMPAYIRRNIKPDQLWVNSEQVATDTAEHHLTFSGITPATSKQLCAYAKAHALPCSVTNKVRLPLSSFIHEQAIPIADVETLENKAMDRYFSMADSSETLFSHRPIKEIPDHTIATNDKTVANTVAEQVLNEDGTHKPLFNINVDTIDTLEAKAAKAAYDAARKRFVTSIKTIGNGINAGNGTEATREELTALGRELFETAGDVYLSSFLQRESKQADVLLSDSSVSDTFIKHLQSNISRTASTTVDNLIDELLSSASQNKGLSDSLLKKTTDQFILSSAESLIDASLAAARKSDVYALRHLELEYNLNNFDDPYVSALLTQPAYQSFDLRHNIFLQGGGVFNEKSIDTDDDVLRDTLNLGAAYRYLTTDERYLYGANLFFDHQWPYNHSRINLGVDAKAKHLNFVSNYYYPLTGFRQSRTDSAGNIFEEQALEGYDIELGYSPPQHAALTIFGKAYQYFRDTDEDIQSLELSAEYNVNNNFILKGSFIGENGGNRDNIELALQYRFPLYQADKPNLVLADGLSVRSKVFEKVRRENRIRVEERLKTAPIENLVAQFNAASIGLPFAVGGILTSANISLPLDTPITIGRGEFGIISFGNGAVANISASGTGDVVLSFNNDVLSITETNGGFVQFTSADEGIRIVTIPGATINLLGTDIDITDDGTTASVQVRAGQIALIPNAGTTTANANQGDVIELVITSGTTSLLSSTDLESRQEAAYSQLDLVNPAPSVNSNAAPFVNAAPTISSQPPFIGNTADVRLRLSQAVNVTGIPFLNAVINTNTRTFSYISYIASESTPTELIFRHTFASGDEGANTMTLKGLKLNNGTITGIDNGLDAITAFTDTVLSIEDS